MLAPNGIGKKRDGNRVDDGESKPRAPTRVGRIRLSSFDRRLERDFRGDGRLERGDLHGTTRFSSASRTMNSKSVVHDDGTHVRNPARMMNEQTAERFEVAIGGNLPTETIGERT